MRHVTDLSFIRLHSSQNQKTYTEMDYYLLTPNYKMLLRIISVTKASQTRNKDDVGVYRISIL